MSDERILFPEAKVGEILVLPWNFGMLFEISDVLDQVIDKVNEKGLTAEVFQSDYIPYDTIAKLFTIASRPLLTIICKTLDKDEEFVKNLKMEDGIEIAFIIGKQNWTTIKNALAPLLLANAQIVGTEPE